MIGLGLIRIAHREPGNRFFEVLVSSDVRADLQRVPGSRVGARQNFPTDARIRCEE